MALLVRIGVACFRSIRLSGYEYLIHATFLRPAIEPDVGHWEVADHFSMTGFIGNVLERFDPRLDFAFNCLGQYAVQLFRQLASKEP